jgi:hypothetical protein
MSSLLEILSLGLLQCAVVRQGEVRIIARRPLGASPVRIDDPHGSS